MDRESAKSQDIEEIAELAARLTKENKRYVIAVENALLFAQQQSASNEDLPGNLPSREDATS